VTPVFRSIKGSRHVMEARLFAISYNSTWSNVCSA